MPDIDKEAREIWNFLTAEDPGPIASDQPLAQYSQAGKDLVAARVAHDTNLPATVLARLPLIRTHGNRANLIAALLANLKSPDPEARKFSLLGLHTLDHPEAVSLAESMLDDDSDSVLLAAVNLLVPLAKQNPAVLRSLRRFHARRKGDERFPWSLSVIEAGGLPDQ